MAVLAFIVPIVMFALLLFRRKLALAADKAYLSAIGLSVFGIAFNIKFMNASEKFLMSLPGVGVKAGLFFFIIILLYLITIVLAALGVKEKFNRHMNIPRA